MIELSIESYSTLVFFIGFFVGVATVLLVCLIKKGFTKLKDELQNN